MDFGFGADEQFVAADDDDAVFETVGVDAQGWVVVVDDVAGAFEETGVAFDRVGLGVVGDGAVDGVPRTEIVPVELGRDDETTGGDFGQGDIHGFGLEGLECGDGLGIVAGDESGAEGLEGGVDGWVSFGECVGEGTERPEEHAGVPEVSAGFEVGDGTFAVGFFVELGDVVDGAGRGIAHFDVAESGFGTVGGDADDADGVVGGAGGEEFVAGGEEGFEGLDVVVGGEEGHFDVAPGFWVAGAGATGGPDDGADGVALVGFGVGLGGIEMGTVGAGGFDEGGDGLDDDVFDSG